MNVSLLREKIERNELSIFLICVLCLLFCFFTFGWIYIKEHPCKKQEYVIIDNYPMYINMGTTSVPVGLGSYTSLQCVERF